MGDCEESFADEAELVGEKVVRIATGDDHVLDDGVGGDVGECFLPTGLDRLVGCLGYGFGVAADGVGAGAVSAVEATHGCCWMLVLAKLNI